MAFALAILGGGASAWGQFNGDFAIEHHFLSQENFFDWKAYQYPITWRYRWLTVANGLRATVGSISQERFYVSQQIRFEFDVGRYGTFLYDQEEESFFRPDPIYQEVELRVGEGYYASLIGFPRHDKRLTALGVALAYGERTDWDFVRISRLDQFAYYNEKNFEPDRFQRIPVLERLQARTLWAGRLFVNLDLKRENLARFDEKAPPVVRRYEGEEVELTVDWWSGAASGLPGERVVGFTWRDDLERRAQEPQAPGEGTPLLRERLELAWLDLYWGRELGGRDFLTLGYLDSHFSDRIRADDPEARYRNLLGTGQAYAVWERNRHEWLSWIFSLQAGLADLTTKEGTARATRGDQGARQVKAGVGLVLAEEERYRLFFNSTWDLDLISGRQWDGGNVQVMFHF